MDFLLEMLLMAILSLFFAFLLSVAMAGNSGGSRGNDPSSDQAENSEISTVRDEFVTKELRFAPVVESERNLRLVHENNVETVDRYGIEADELVEEAATENEESGIRTAEADSRGEIGARTMEAVENVESEEVRDESSGYKMGLNAEEEEKEEELVIEEDDDWEGIERSELEKDFAAAASFVEESGKAEEIGNEAKMELYGLHKIATEGSCREAQPMAVMVSARARWNAWQKLGNMNQEEAMEQYLALVSKEIPAFNDNAAAMLPVVAGEEQRSLINERSEVLGNRDEETIIFSSSEDVDYSKICVICFEERKNCFFVPCGHSATCHRCAQKILSEENKMCPICRRVIRKSRRLLLRR